jgi:hypothetical protein
VGRNHGQGADIPEGRKRAKSDHTHRSKTLFDDLVVPAKQLDWDGEAKRDSCSFYATKKLKYRTGYGGVRGADGIEL